MLARFYDIDGDYLAAERILDGEFLGRVHALLGEQQIMAGIAARGQSYAAPLSYFTRGDNSALVFKMIVANTFEKAGEVGISPGLFIIIDRRLNSMAEFG